MGRVHMIIESLAEFESFSFLLGQQSIPGQLILLEGEMGTGKTTFVQSFAKGAGSLDRVSSPTFRLIHRYSGKFPIFHLDLFRLDSVEAILQLDIDQYLDFQVGVVVIEWPQLVLPLIKKPVTHIQLGYHSTPEFRKIEVSSRENNSGKKLV